LNGLGEQQAVPDVQQVHLPGRRPLFTQYLYSLINYIHSLTMATVTDVQRVHLTERRLVFTQ
jgi:hypothetical protein